MSKCKGIESFVCVIQAQCRYFLIGDQRTTLTSSHTDTTAWPLGYQMKGSLITSEPSTTGLSITGFATYPRSGLPAAPYRLVILSEIYTPTPFPTLFLGAFNTRPSPSAFISLSFLSLLFLSLFGQPLHYSSTILVMFLNCPLQCPSFVFLSRLLIQPPHSPVTDLPTSLRLPPLLLFAEPSLLRHPRY